MHAEFTHCFIPSYVPNGRNLHESAARSTSSANRGKAVTEGVASVVLVSGVLLWLAVSLLPAVVGAAESLVLVLALALGDLLD